MSEASWVRRLITTKQTAQDASGATIETSGDLHVDSHSDSAPITSAFTVSTALTALEQSKRVWTPWKTAQNAVSHSAHTRRFSLRKKKDEQLKQRS